MFEVPDQQKRFAPDGMEIMSFDLPGLDEKLSLRVSRIGQVQIDRLALRVVLNESSKAFEKMRIEMELAVAEAYRNGMRDGHATAAGVNQMIGEGAL